MEALVPDFRKANYQGLRYHLQSIDWEVIGVGRGEDQNNEVEMQYSQTKFLKRRNSIYQKGGLDQIGMIQNG